MIGSTADSTAPTVYPYVADDSTGLAVNEAIKFGFNEAMDGNTLNFTSGGLFLRRGNTNISASAEYDPGSFELTIQPNDVLPPNTAITVSFINPTVKDLAGNAIAVGTIFNYTTGDIDTGAPVVNGGSGCDDYQCRVSFTEPMEHVTLTGANYNNSVLKPGNFAFVVGGNPVDLTTGGVQFTYQNNGVDITNLQLINSVGESFTMTVTGVKDMSGNNISTSNGENVVVGVIEGSSSTFGNFGGGGGAMFGPPSVGGGMIGGEFDFGNQVGGFAMDDFFGGSATSAFPFNRIAGLDSGVMQFNFAPDIAAQDGDQVVITLPPGTGVGSAAQDQRPPFKDNFHMDFAA